MSKSTMAVSNKPCRCHEHGSQTPLVTDEKKQLLTPDGRRVEVEVVKGDPKVIEIVDEKGNGKAYMMPKPYFEQPKKEK